MTATVPAADVRELAAAIRTALDPPRAAVRADRARLMEERAAYINGALLVIATGDAVMMVRAATDVIREAVADVPVTYEVQTMLAAPLPLSSLRDREHYEGTSEYHPLGSCDACSQSPDLAALAAYLAPPAPYGHQSLQPNAGA